jgi:secondary thiamine-phosphate synthase enzyme
MVIQDRIELETQHHGEMCDITEAVQLVVDRSGILNGIVHVFNIGSTGSIGTIEYEPGLIHDLPTELNRLFPPGTHYGHEKAWHDGNGHSHLQATTMGPGLTVPLARGQLVLGTWQQIFHLECDIKPRSRTVFVTVMGDQ